MSHRFKQAISITQGVNTPGGIAAALLAALKEIENAGGSAADVIEDPAVQLMGYHLGSALQTWRLDNLSVFHELSEKCKTAAALNYLTLVPNGTDGASQQDLADFVRRIAMRDSTTESVDDIVTEARALILGVDNEIEKDSSLGPRM